MLTKLHVIFSASKQSSEDQRNTSLLARWLSDNGFVSEQVTGSYKGVEEQSFIVQCDDFAQVDQLVRRAKYYEQESVLIIDARQKCFLYYPDTKQLDYIGRWYKGTPESNPTASFTIINGEYHYVI